MSRSRLLFLLGEIGSAPDGKALARARRAAFRRLDPLARSGPDTTSSLRTVLDQSEAIVARGASEAADSYLRSLNALNTTVAALGLGSRTP